MIFSSKKISVSIWLLITILNALTWITPLEYEYKLISYLMAIISICGFPLIIWLTTFDEKVRNKWRKITLLVFPLTILSIFVIDFFTWGGGFKTQDILFRSKKFSNITVEFQMEDIGAFGYNRRTVRVIQLTPMLKWTTFIEIDKIDLNEWMKVDEYVNELGLKGG